MCHYPIDRNLFVPVFYFCDQSIIVPADVEDYTISVDVGRPKSLFHVVEIFPCRFERGLAPYDQR
jgi:hypothetical protein